VRSVRVVPAAPDDGPRMAALVAQAFHPLAVSAWLVPDPIDRARILPAHFDILIDHALQHGNVDTTTDLTAVAVWVDRTHPVSPPVDYDQRLVRACGGYVDRFRILDDLFDTHHPQRPHHHLALLAVHPDLHGAGLGSVLLEHRHNRLDTERIPAYLEAACPRSRALYARHGYRPHGPSHLQLPDGPAMYPMWRNPQ